MDKHGVLRFADGLWRPDQDNFDAALKLTPTAERGELERLKELALAGRLTRRVRGADGIYQVERSVAPCVRAIDLDLRTVTVIASDDTLDSYGDTIAADGWKFERFARNPVALIDHDYSVAAIVGQSIKWWVEKKALMITDRFDGPWTNDTADMAWNKIVSGSLRAVSVGFRPMKWVRRYNDKDEWTGGFDYLEQELYEKSWVAVPANPSAVVTDAVHAAEAPPVVTGRGLAERIAVIERKAGIAAIASRIM
jgi:HK97 family phage prohead protease